MHTIAQNQPTLSSSSGKPKNQPQSCSLPPSFSRFTASYCHETADVPIGTSLILTSLSLSRCFSPSGFIVWPSRTFEVYKNVILSQGDGKGVVCGPALKGDCFCWCQGPKVNPVFNLCVDSTRAIVAKLCIKPTWSCETYSRVSGRHVDLRGWTRCNRCCCCTALEIPHQPVYERGICFITVIVLKTYRYRL